MSKLILTIRTDNPDAEIGLYQDSVQLDYMSWRAHRQLAETLHLKIRELLATHDAELQDIDAVVAYHGPGSFTGLRIGLSVVNALASSYDIPVIGVTGDGWQLRGIEALNARTSQRLVLPEYGAPVHITPQKK